MTRPFDHRRSRRESKSDRTEEKKKEHEGVRRLAGTEPLFFEALPPGVHPKDAPEWFLYAIVSTLEEDSRQVDALVETADVGRILVQIKSSEREAEKFRGRQKRDAEASENRNTKRKRRLHPHIVVIVVNTRMSLEEIRKNTYEALGEKRKYFLESRKH